MNIKLSPLSRLNLLARHKKGESVTVLCHEFNISRTLFYRLVKRKKPGKSTLVGVLPQDACLKAHGSSCTSLREVQLDILRAVVVHKWSVTKVCATYGISRTLFYRWLHKYKTHLNISSSLEEHVDNSSDGFQTSLPLRLYGNLKINSHSDT